MQLTEIPCPSAVVAAALVLLTVVYYLIKNKGVFPGPKGVPYLGLYPTLTEERVHLQLFDYKKKYGDVFSFTYTGRLFINLGSVKAIRELHVNKSDCFRDRFQDTNVMVQMLRNGVAFLNGEAWKVLRRFFVQRFKDHGLNTVRDNMAGPVYDSLNAIIEDLNALKEMPVNIVDLLGQRCTVTMRRMIFGESGVTDEELGKLNSAYSVALEGNTGINLLLVGPLARLLFKTKPSFRKNFKYYNEMRDIIQVCAKKIEANMNEEHPTCIIEDFYKERNEKQRSNDPAWKYYTDDALVESVLQFVGDGILSVAALIAGQLNALIEYPDEQDKLYTEITEVVGPNRQPALEDRSSMPYTNAFMCEVIRTSSFLNMFPSLECTKETTFRGYRIPKGSITLLNFYSAHHDPETFEDPDTFNPSRYLASPEKSKAELPVLFGMGKRSCSGEQFVMTQTFLFLTTIVKNFKVMSSNANTSKNVDFLLTGQLELTFTPRADNQ